jgi:UPF0288 family protein (methanogenesis marker protein 3)|tara:strand:- start:834 stop:1211 length:378 start_codon:yes stop_codon:yes gene_type:complete
MGILGGVGYGGYMYYIDTQERLGILRENNAKLVVANDAKDATIKQMLETQNKAAELNQALTVRLQKSEEYGDTLRSKFAKINILRMAIDEPYILEGKINNAVTRLLDGLRDDTNTDADRVSGSEE